jgi:hypothetical protein
MMIPLIWDGTIAKEAFELQKRTRLIMNVLIVYAHPEPTHLMRR